MHILNYFYVYLVSNVGAQSTWYALIVPHTSECWPEDGLIGPKYEGWNFNIGNYLFTTDTK